MLQLAGIRQREVQIKATGFSLPEVWWLQAVPKQLVAITEPGAPGGVALAPSASGVLTATWTRPLDTGDSTPAWVLAHYEVEVGRNPKTHSCKT